MYKLTQEGLTYLKEGLPEKRLLEALRSGGKPLNEVSKLPYATIGLGWARRNGWVSIENNRVELTEKGNLVLGSKSDFEKSMEEVNKKGEATNKEVEKLLLNRTLIEEMKVESVTKKTSLIERLFQMIFGKHEEKKTAETEIAQLTPEHLKTGAWKTIPFRKYDVSAPAPTAYPGRKQPYFQLIESMRLKLVGLGFTEMTGPFVETSFWNMDALFMPQDHPGRGIHDVLYLKKPHSGTLPEKNIVAKVKATHEGGWITESSGWGGLWSEMESAKLVMRSQTTAASARTLAEHGDKPGKYFTINRVFRHDIVDAKHLIEFDQMEGIVIDENLTLRHLLGLLKEFGEALGADKIRFKPAYFPFTEPSVELYAHLKSHGWIEMGGAGLFRPEVLKPLGIEHSQVLAWGLGIGRLAMIKLGIDDIRYLYSDDLQWLRNKEMVK